MSQNVLNSDDLVLKALADLPAERAIPIHNAEPYFFQGVVRPERAQISLNFALGFTHIGTGVNAVARVDILLNQIAVWVESDHDWDIFDLRNVVKSLLQNQLALVGYIKGYAYEFEISRILSPSRGLDQVFGIDIPCLAKRGESADLQAVLIKLRKKTLGPNGVFLHRCFSDLVSAMKHADDTAFCCYRAIESLRHHCAGVYDLSASNKGIQWAKFREVSGCQEQTIRLIKLEADPLRHGAVASCSSDERGKLFTTTWDIVDGYLNGG